MKGFHQLSLLMQSQVMPGFNYNLTLLTLSPAQNWKEFRPRSWEQSCNALGIHLSWPWGTCSGCPISEHETSTSRYGPASVWPPGQMIPLFQPFMHSKGRPSNGGMPGTAETDQTLQPMCDTGDVVIGEHGVMLLDKWEVTHKSSDTWSH